MKNASLYIKLPWTLPRVFTFGELQANARQELVDFNREFRLYLSSRSFLTKRLTQVQASFRDLDNRATLSGKDLIDFHHLSRELVILQSILHAKNKTSLPALLEEYFYRLGRDHPSWYFVADDSYPLLDQPSAALLRPPKNDLMNQFDEFLATQKSLSDAKVKGTPVNLFCNSINEMPFCISIISHFQCQSIPYQVIMENHASIEASLLKEFRSLLPKTPRPNGRSSSSLQTLRKGDLLRLVWFPRESSFRPLSTTIKQLRSRSIPLHLTIHLPAQPFMQEAMIFEIMDRVIQLQWEIKGWNITMHTQPSEISPKEISNFIDVMSVQLEAELENPSLLPAYRSKKRFDLSEGKVRFHAEPSVRLESRYPLDRFSAWERRLEERSYRYGWTPSIPHSHTVQAKASEFYLFFPPSPMVIGKSSKYSSTHRLIKAFAKSTPVSTLFRRAEFQEKKDELLYVLDTLHRNGILQVR